VTLTQPNNNQSPLNYTHSVMDLGVNTCRGALGSIFSTEKKRRSSVLNRVFSIEEKPKIRYRWTWKHL